VGCAAAVLLAACSSGSGGTSQVPPANTASAAVQNFMKAVADSNLTSMANLWGTSRGPAAKTREPSDFERRVAVMQAYLSHDDYRILSDVPDGSDPPAPGCGSGAGVHLDLPSVIND
jgi:hypothetical protein